jgi:hypothetical protein
MTRLYQWLSERASFFFSDSTGNRTSHTVRTEVTVQREAMILLVSEIAACGVCPLCGQTVAAAQVEQASVHLQKASTLPGTGSVDAHSLEVKKIRACAMHGGKHAEVDEGTTT